MKNETKKNSGIPLIIIAVVGLIVLVTVYFLYNSSKNSPSSNANRANAAQNRNTQPQAANAPPGAQPPHMLGSAAATVTVEEFADFQCPSCATTHPVLKEVQQIYGSRIRFIFRHYPLQMHDKAYDAAVATEAAAMQGSDKFWAMHNQLYSNQKSWSVDNNFRGVLLDYAQKIGLDVAKFQTDMAGLQTKKRVDDDMQRGRALGVSSTPTVYINGQAVPYPEMNVQSLRQLIDSELQRSAAQRPAVVPAANANAASQAPVGNTK